MLNPLNILSLLRYLSAVKLWTIYLVIHKITKSHLIHKIMHCFSLVFSPVQLTAYTWIGIGGFTCISLDKI